VLLLAGLGEAGASEGQKQQQESAVSSFHKVH
jgi:hypothetical protein